MKYGKPGSKIKKGEKENETKETKRDFCTSRICRKVQGADVFRDVPLSRCYDNGNDPIRLHLAGGKRPANIRKQGVAHMMKAPLGFFDSNASGLLRNRLDGGAAETETLLAHNLADIVGTAAMFIGMLVLMFVFDWRMGASCLVAAVISVGAMFTMMGGKNAKLMMEYQTAQDVMSKAGTEYVRGIPVVKVFQQTVYSFKAFKAAIEDYSNKAEKYTGGVCRVPQSVNLTATEGVFIFLVPAVLLIAPSALSSGDFAAAEILRDSSRILLFMLCSLR